MIAEILDGWANHIKDKFGILNPTTKLLSEKRLLICDNCPMRKGDRCSGDNSDFAIIDFVYRGVQRYKGMVYNGCGCNVIKKSMSRKSQCPLGKFLAE